MFTKNFKDKLKILIIKKRIKKLFKSRTDGYIYITLLSFYPDSISTYIRIKSKSLKKWTVVIIRVSDHEDFRIRNGYGNTFNIDTRKPFNVETEREIMRFYSKKYDYFSELNRIVENVGRRKIS